MVSLELVHECLAFRYCMWINSWCSIFPGTRQHHSRNVPTVSTSLQAGHWITTCITHMKNAVRACFLNSFARKKMYVILLLARINIGKLSVSVVLLIVSMCLSHCGVYNFQSYLSGTQLRSLTSVQTLLISHQVGLLILTCIWHPPNAAWLSFPVNRAQRKMSVRMERRR